MVQVSTLRSATQFPFCTEGEIHLTLDGEALKTKKYADAHVVQMACHSNVHIFPRMT